MPETKPLSAAEKQSRFRERRSAERQWFRRELLRLHVEIAKLRAPDLSISEGNTVG